MKGAVDSTIELELCRIRVRQLRDRIATLRDERDRCNGRIDARTKVWLEGMILDYLPRAEARLAEAEEINRASR